MSFWTDSTLQDPKRKFRFRVMLSAYPNSATWYAKSVSKPSFEIGGTTHVFLNHTFKYPGQVTWQDVSCTLVDPVSPDAVANTMAIIQNAGYVIPGGPSDLTTMSKRKAVAALGGVVIDQIDDVGNFIESWTLKNAYIDQVTLDELSYGEEALSEIKLRFKYDWATCETANVAGNLSTPPVGVNFPFSNSSRFFEPTNN